jgi:hypothetical protein
MGPAIELDEHVQRSVVELEKQLERFGTSRVAALGRNSSCWTKG